MASTTASAVSEIAKGAIDVKLVDASTGKPLAGVDVTALERVSTVVDDPTLERKPEAADAVAVKPAPSFELRWRKRVKTDANGVAHFELPGLGQRPGASYVFRAKPFSQRVTSAD